MTQIILRNYHLHACSGRIKQINYRKINQTHEGADINN